MRLRTLAAVLLLAACGKKNPVSRYVSASWGFSCEFPSGWQVRERDGGAMAAAPDQASVSVTFYADKNQAFASASDYVKDHTRPGGPRKIDPGLPLGSTVAGLKAVEFTRDLSEPADMAHPGSPSEQVKESYAVVEGGGGFFALVYSAPAAVYERELPAFARLKDSFHAP